MIAVISNILIIILIPSQPMFTGKGPGRSSNLFSSPVCHMFPHLPYAWSLLTSPNICPGFLLGSKLKVELRGTWCCIVLDYFYFKMYLYC